MAKRDASASNEALYELDPADKRAMPGVGEIANYAVRTIRAGEIVELEAYPIFKPGTRSAQRAKAGGTREAQKMVNARNRRKHISRLINANFVRGDIVLTRTYAQEPENDERAHKDLRNYIDRVKRLQKRLVKEGRLPAGHALKWLCVTEITTKDGRPARVHHHIVCNMPDRDALEACWQKGRANARRLQPDKFFLTAIGRYISKAPAHKSRLRRSTNLREPTVTYAQKKLSKKRAQAIAQDMDCAAPEILRKLYPGCEFLSCEVRLSEFVQGAYIYAMMRTGGTYEQTELEHYAAGG